MIAGFRNRLTHHYDVVTPEELYIVLQSHLGDIDRLADQLEAASRRLLAPGGATPHPRLTRGANPLREYLCRHGFRASAWPSTRASGGSRMPRGPELRMRRGTGPDRGISRGMGDGVQKLQNGV